VNGGLSREPGVPHGAAETVVRNGTVTAAALKLPEQCWGP